MRLNIFLERKSPENEGASVRESDETLSELIITHGGWIDSWYLHLIISLIFT